MFTPFSMETFNWAAESLFVISGASFLWGLSSSVLSPCHLGIVPILGSHAAGYTILGIGQKPLYQVFLFTLGFFFTIPIIGFFIFVIGHGLHLGGHYWTIPSGVLLLWLGVDMMRVHSCSRLSNILGKLRSRLKLGIYSSAVVLGLTYGFLAGGCSAGFLVPIFAITLPQGIEVCLIIAVCFGLGHTLPMTVAGCSASLAKRFLHDHNHACCENKTLSKASIDPHVGEARFRKLVGIVTIVIGVLFILHPLLE